MIKKIRFPKYDEAEMCREYEFKVGLEFKTLSQFKDAIKEHVLLNGKDVRYKKNEKLRCRVVCKGQKGKCKWICFAIVEKICGWPLLFKEFRISICQMLVLERLTGQGEKQGKKYMEGPYYNMPN
ncbi:hypothetical protein Ahy_A02g007577 [Arachis hypogaea]|uniref:Transposase MuDR plant domain-containing protein n=1 Tax=Arachis hypogaea TaxID=3818 RepID=A0A445ED82_ARAHY|nr:hypothetical protein Ahy_A02g007577 [Arachis hypogaea]